MCDAAEKAIEALTQERDNAVQLATELQQLLMGLMGEIKDFLDG